MAAAHFDLDHIRGTAVRVSVYACTRDYAFDQNPACIFMAATDAPHNQPEAGRSELSGLRVIIVEDSWQVGTALKRVLRLWGADVAGPVATTADAARLMSERTFDAALVDIHLRGGEQAYSLIDQLHDQGIYVVVVTGYADVSLGHVKAAKVLQKPVPADLLLRTLRAAQRR